MIVTIEQPTDTLLVDPDSKFKIHDFAPGLQADIGDISFLATGSWTMHPELLLLKVFFKKKNHHQKFSGNA